MNLNNMENTIGEYGDKKSFVGGHDMPTRTGGDANYITSRDLNDPEEMYQVGTPQFSNGTTIISTKSADTRNSDTNLNVDNSEINQSAKYKYPNVRQNTSQMPKESGGYDEPSI